MKTVALFVRESASSERGDSILIRYKRVLQVVQAIQLVSITPSQTVKTGEQ